MLKGTYNGHLGQPKCNHKLVGRFRGSSTTIISAGSLTQSELVYTYKRRDRKKKLKKKKEKENDA